MEFIGYYLVAAGLFVVIDAIWLGVVANKVYKKELGSLLRPKPNLFAGAIFYLLYIVGATVFVIQPALDRNSVAYASGGGALFGLVMYATYDLTNLSTLKGWPLRLTLIDMTWGTFVTMVVSTLTFMIFH